MTEKEKEKVKEKASKLDRFDVKLEIRISDEEEKGKGLEYPISVLIPRKKNEVFYSLRDFFSCSGERKEFKSNSGFESAKTKTRNLYKAILINSINSGGYMNFQFEEYLTDEIEIRLQNIKDVNKVESDLRLFVQALSKTYSAFLNEKEITYSFVRNEEGE